MGVKANVQYTALELLGMAGVENPEEQFGNTRIRIAGLRGFSGPNHLVRIPEGANDLEIIVGDETYTLAVDEVVEGGAATKLAKEAIEVRRDEILKQNEQVQQRKQETTQEEPEAEAEAPAEESPEG